MSKEERRAFVIGLDLMVCAVIFGITVLADGNHTIALAGVACAIAGPCFVALGIWEHYRWRTPPKGIFSTTLTVATNLPRLEVGDVVTIDDKEWRVLQANANTITIGRTQAH